MQLIFNINQLIQLTKYFMKHIANSIQWTIPPSTCTLYSVHLHRYIIIKRLVVELLNFEKEKEDSNLSNQVKILSKF